LVDDHEGIPALVRVPSKERVLPAVASRTDPRFGYALALPAQISPSTAVLVAVHGSGRDVEATRDAFIEFGDNHDVLVIAPLFPMGLDGDVSGVGYKVLEWGSLRYDRLLAAMVAEVATTYGLNQQRFGLVGFSGGGQFAHRFGWLHAERLWALSIGAPGTVTALDHSRSYWAGIGDVVDRFGCDVDLPALRRLPVQLVIGDDDRDPAVIQRPAGDPLRLSGPDPAGVTRMDRIHTLHRSLEAAGVQSRLDVVPGVGHQPDNLWPVVRSYLADRLAVLRTARSAGENAGASAC
jgi:pimeloyl-ACP methyl ester carboxylesterase